jgi:pyruvate/2-oxoglutarate dehydrogenase complex dihydrolipoamide dehydrogenase (E3) component
MLHEDGAITMSELEHYRNVVLGSGEAGKYIAWTLAGQGERTAVVERRWIGGSCPNIACLPSKNVIHSAKVASLFSRAAEFGIELSSCAIRMEGVRARKQSMTDALINTHLSNYEKSGAELILGEGRFSAAKTLEVNLRDGGTRRLSADRMFLNVGTHAAIPEILGLLP